MEKPVFLDETGKRWAKVKAFVLIVCMTVSIYGFILYKDMDRSWVKGMQPYLFDVIIIIFQTYLLFGIAVGFLRLSFLIFFSRRQWKKQKPQQEVQTPRYDERFAMESLFRFHQYLQSEIRAMMKLYIGYPRLDVSVIIPVYNEEAVIKKTVAAILDSSYPLKEILVIDDGSKDRTAEIVRAAFSKERKVKLIQKRNGGKASVLNVGFRRAVGDIVITIDADTVFTKHTIAHLVGHFSNPEIAAVSGNCKIGNIRNQLTLWQHIEYVTANNLERRACEELNCIMVVPGSNSAWRKSVVKEVGYFDHDTLAEDTDLTIKVLNAGYRVVFDDQAVSYEECPEKVKDFIKQRFRWSYGILQTVWKHKRKILDSKNKFLKYFAASMMFSYLLFLTSPLIDIIFIVALLSGSKTIFLFALLFYVSDVLAPAYAFRLERENMKPLVWVFFQRIAYRYLISYVTWKAVITALKGSNVCWNKFERSGNNDFVS